MSLFGSKKAYEGAVIGGFGLMINSPYPANVKSATFNNQGGVYQNGDELMKDGGDTRETELMYKIVEMYKANGPGTDFTSAVSTVHIHTLAMTPRPSWL